MGAAAWCGRPRVHPGPRQYPAMVMRILSPGTRAEDGGHGVQPGRVARRAGERPRRGAALRERKAADMALEGGEKGSGLRSAGRALTPAGRSGSRGAPAGGQRPVGEEWIPLVTRDTTGRPRRCSVSASQTIYRPSERTPHCTPCGATSGRASINLRNLPIHHLLRNVVNIVVVWVCNPHQIAHMLLLVIS